MKNPIEGVDYFVYFVPMHGSIGGYVTPNPDGTFSVYLNERLSREKNMKTMRHEYQHMVNDDFAKHDIAKIEGL